MKLFAGFPMHRTIPHLALLFVAALVVRAAADDAQVRAAAADMAHGDFSSAERKLRAELRLHPDDAHVLSLLGAALDGEKKLPEAAEFHRRAVAAAPGSADALSYQGSHFLAAGDEKAARDAYLKAVAANPSHVNANIGLARLALRHSAAAEALSYLKRLPANQQDTPQAAALRVQTLYMLGSAAEADALVERLSTPAKGDPALSYSLGMALGSAGQFEKCEPFLASALTATPADFNLLYHLGVCATRAGHYDHAREALEPALRQQPDNVEVLYALAYADEGLEQREVALGLLARAAKLAPARADIQKEIALIATELRAWADAAAAWDRYLTLAPNDDVARRERGFNVVRTGQFEQGAADLRWFLDRHPDDPDGHYELAMAELDVDQDAAMAELDKAIALKPDFAAARSTRGGLYCKEGQPETALPDLEFAAAHLPDDAVTLDRLGANYASLDRPSDAVKLLRKAVALDPNDPAKQYHLARALADAGQTAEAEAAMERFRQMGPARKFSIPEGLVNYLGMTPEERRTNLRARVESAVAKDPTDGAAQLQDLQLELEEGHVDRAVDAAHRIAALKPDAAVLADAGRALLESNQDLLAMDLLGRAAAVAPSPEIDLDLAIAAFHVQGAAAGLARLDGIPEAGRSGDYYLGRAQMLDASGKSEEAAAALEQALHAAPKRADLYWQAAALLSVHGKTAEALRLLDQAVRDLPDAREIPLARAITLEISGQTTGAGDLLKEVGSRWPEWPAGWVARGIIFDNHGSFEQARQAMETAVSLGARSAQAYYYLADSALRTTPKRIDEAGGAAAQALKLAPSEPWIQDVAGRVALAKGDDSTAIERLREAVRLGPNLAPPHEALAQAYSAMGRKAEAQAEADRLKKTQNADANPPFLTELFQAIPLRDW
jgi:tetratricopeptide (TPR) repeat protein